MRTKRDLAARAGKAFLPIIAMAFIMALVIASNREPPASPNETGIGGIVRPSGSYNTRIYLTSINTYSQVQGGYFVLRGYVTVANVSNPPNWDPWPNVAVALRMNGTFIHQTPAPGDIVQTTTNGTGNFTLSYQVTLNHTVGDWTITAGIAPIPNYNYTYDPLFSGTAPYIVNVTANVNIPQPLQYTPGGVFINDAFSISGRLFTTGGFPAPGVPVQASFNNTANYTSPPTDGTGFFTINVTPPVSNYYTSLVLHVPKTGYYNAGSFPIPGFKFIDSVTHNFSGDVAASAPSNPTPVNSTITISGRFTYNRTLFGGDGNVKNKLVRVYWKGTLIGTCMTDALGQYQLPYTINASEPTGLPYSTLIVTASLDAPVAGRNGTATFYIRPMIATRLTITTRPAWKDERVIIRGILSENEAPNYLRFVTGATVIVRLWNGAVMLDSMNVITNATGGFLANFTAQNLDALNFTVDFLGRGPHVGTATGFTAVPIYKTAVFVFDPGMDTATYPGPPYPIHVFGRAYARGFSQPDKPIPSRQVNVYWDGTNMSGLACYLDATGSFSFYISTNWTTPAGIHAITLELWGISGPGYSVSSSYLIQIRPLRDINITLGSYITNPIFPDEPLHLDGNISQRVGGLYLQVYLTYNTSLTISYSSIDCVTLASGLFHVVLPGGYINSSLDSLRVAVNEACLSGYNNATTANYPITFINPWASPSAVNFTEISINGIPIAAFGSISQGSSITISGVLVSHLGTRVGFYRVQVVDASTGLPVASGLTDAAGAFALPVNLAAAAAGSTYAFYLRTDYSGGAVPPSRVYASTTYSIQVVAADPLGWILWLIPVAVVGLVLLGLAYVKIQQKKELALIRSYMQQKLDLVRQLVAEGKNREGIAYCYHTLVEVATRAYNLDEVKESETVREFIEMLVNEKNLPRDVSFKFMMAVIEGLYSNQNITRDHVAAVVGLLGKLYVAITSDTRETFTL
ncbi:MAG: hypothetical protein Q6373_018525 [Candidatus Sigynarchaeota archaeon]